MNNLLFYDNDKNGFIKNLIESDSINIKKLSVFFDSIKNIFHNYLSNNLKSIFVTYKKHKNNNFTVIVIVITNNSFEKNTEIEKSFNELKNSFLFIDTLNVLFYSGKEINNNFELLFDLKINFICIYGEDLTKQIKSFRPSIENLNFNFQKLILIIAQFETLNLNRASIEEISKIILGSCYELCMDREKKYSQNKYFFYKTFSKYYPDKEIFAKEIFKNLNIHNDIDDKLFIKLLQYFGKWLLLQYDKIIIEKKLLID